MYDLRVDNVKLEGVQQAVDIGILEGVITDIAPSGSLVQTAKTLIDGHGLMVLPPYIEPHIHLDSVLTAGEPRWNESGTLFEGIQCWTERKPLLTRDDVLSRASQALQWMVAQGTLHVRTHVDVTDPQLIALQALLELRERVKPYVTLQIVAFPQEGTYSYQNGRGLALLEEAIQMGADVVGAIPHYEYTREYGVKSVDACFEIAEKYDRMVDVHCDEIDDEQSRFVWRRARSNARWDRVLRLAIRQPCIVTTMPTRISYLVY